MLVAGAPDGGGKSPWASGRALCLVTGGAGFIGSNLVHKLVELDARVRVLDNFSTGRRENLAELEGCVDQVACWACRHKRVQ